MTAIKNTNPNEWRRVLRLGDVGPDVCAWQLVLINVGLSPSDIAGQFGTQTHNATLDWQTSHGLTRDGVVGPNTRGSIENMDRIGVTVSAALPLEIKLVEAAHYSRHLPPRSSVDWVVLHCMEAPESSTRAERCAANFAAGAREASAHYCVDSDSVVQCVPEEQIAWHAPGANRRGIGIEHAGYARQTRGQWFDPFSRAMLGLSVQLTARICQRWNIPPVALEADGLNEQKRGITTHLAVSEAFKKSKHWDPGHHFPLDWYAEQVKAILDDS